MNIKIMVNLILFVGIISFYSIGSIIGILMINNNFLIKKECDCGMRPVFLKLDNNLPIQFIELNEIENFENFENYLNNKINNNNSDFADKQIEKTDVSRKNSGLKNSELKDDKCYQENIFYES